MYTYEEVKGLVIDMGEWCAVIDQYAICDPDGTEIACVRTEEEAEILLSHLNR